ncbi:WbqC family protein [Coralliovum pocilloporae]|uniref:WbqC family protein n=1 Tax=Coralliovum pocilloporae TaxID=3066369 RepID=UPI00330727AC
MKKVAILQSNYIPWKGYFDIIRQVDLFIFHDDLRYTKNDWRNRNRIQTETGSRWVTIPCGTDQNRLINEVRVDQVDWQAQHYRLLEENYRAAPYWDVYSDFVKEVYLKRKWQFLSELNQFLIRHIASEFLGAQTAFDQSENYNLSHRGEARVLELLTKAGATRYLSGPAGRNYLQENSFDDCGIMLEYMDYSSYRPYRQCHEPFDHAVTILDLLFNTGPDALDYMLPCD